MTDDATAERAAELKSRAVTMAEGNPGAATALGQLVASQSDAADLFDTLADHDITGSYVWVGFKDHCEQDIDRFAQAIRDEDDAMLEEIEEYRELRGDA